MSPPFEVQAFKLKSTIFVSVPSLAILKMNPPLSVPPPVVIPIKSVPSTSIGPCGSPTNPGAGHVWSVSTVCA